MPGIILASASPRRSWLLSLLDVPFQVIPPDIPEDFHPGESPEDHVLRLAMEKASRVFGRFAGRVVIAADTVVVLGDRVYGKPAGNVEARGMLEELTGRTHRVLTGYAIHDNGNRTWRDLEESLVTMKPMKADGIEEYLALGEYGDKAGSYAVQGKGARLIDKIEGSYTNVVGLPLKPVIEILSSLGYCPVEPSLDHFLSGDESFRPRHL